MSTRRQSRRVSASARSPGAGCNGRHLRLSSGVRPRAARAPPGGLYPPAPPLGPHMRPAPHLARAGDIALPETHPEALMTALPAQPVPATLAGVACACPLLPPSEGVELPSNRTTLVVAATPASPSTSRADHSALAAGVALCVSSGLAGSGIHLIHAELVANKDPDTASPSGYVVLVSCSAPAEAVGGAHLALLGSQCRKGAGRPR